MTKHINGKKEIKNLKLNISILDIHTDNGYTVTNCGMYF